MQLSDFLVLTVVHSFCNTILYMPKRKECKACKESKEESKKECKEEQQSEQE